MRFDKSSGLFHFCEGKSAPAPDYTGAANAQAASSKETTAIQNWANRPTINTPWGQLNWGTQAGVDPGTGTPITEWTQNIALDKDTQQGLDSQQRVQTGRSQAAEGLLGQATDAFNTPFNWDDAPDAGSLGNYDPDKIRQRSENALFAKQKRRFEPMLDQAEEARRTRLANMGISPEGGSVAWDRAQEDMDDTRRRTYEEATLNSITGGGQEAQRELGLRTGAANEMDRQRAQYIMGEAQRRGMPLNELNALLTGQQVSQPTFGNAPNNTAAGSQAAQYLTAAQMQGMYQPQGSDWGSAVGGIASIAAMFSDRRLKSNIRRIGTHPRGIGLYIYDIFGATEVGVMAQEVLAVAPELVIKHPSGYLMVNYGGL